jgi:hypothetical protein
MNAYTKFCTEEPKNRLKSEWQGYAWTQEKRVEGKDLSTQVDIFGESDNRIILIQFEMHREAVTTNALKTAYCLENNRHFVDKQLLILHVLSPFHEKPEETPNDLDRNQPPEGTEQEVPNGFMRYLRRRETRAAARKNAYNHKLLCFFLKQKQAIDNATTTYEVIEWEVDDSAVRKATIELPDKGPFPEGTRNAIAILAKRLGEVIEEWQKE